MARSLRVLVFALPFVGLSAAQLECETESCEEVQDLQLLQHEIALHLEKDVARKRTAGKPVLIATGLEDWSVSLYHRLKSSGVPVRIIPNCSTKAAELLQCKACDETEGVFLVTPDLQYSDEGRAVVRRALTGVRAVVSHPLSYKDAEADIPDIIKITAQESPTATFVMISEFNTTAVDGPSGRRQVILHWETELLASGLSYAILKTCRRVPGPAGDKELVVSPADQTQLVSEFEGVSFDRFKCGDSISHADVARVAMFWATLPAPDVSSEGLRSGARFDICSRNDGKPTTDAALQDLAAKAWNSWQLVDYKTPNSESLMPALDARPILVTGATGRTGRFVYQQLKSKGIPTRAFVRNRTRAREVLGCDTCDEKEGIFVGEVVNAESFMPAIWDVRGIIITTTGNAFVDESGEGRYPEAREIDMFGTYMQVFAAGEAAEKSGVRPFVFYVSAMGIDAQDPEQFSFNKLNGEASTMAQGLPFAIVKPCGLNDEPGGKAEILVGPGDAILGHPRSTGTISRTDLAKLLVEMANVVSRDQARGLVDLKLRFNACSGDSATPTNLDDQATVQGLMRQSAYLAD